MPDPELIEANEQRVLYLRRAGILTGAQVDSMYCVSLLEFLLGDRLQEAKDYHQHRIAVHLAEACASVEVSIEQQKSMEARRKLSL